MASLQRALVSIPLNAGLQQKVDPRVMDPPNLVNLVNYQFSKDGALDVRDGIRDLPVTALATGGPAPSYVTGAFVYGDEQMLLCDGRSTYASGDPEVAGWARVGLMPEAAITRESVGATVTNMPGAYDAAATGDYTAFVTLSTTTVFAFSVYKAGAKLYSFTYTTAFAAVGQVRMVGFNGNFVFAWSDGAALRIYRFDPDNPVVTAMAAGGGSTGLFDMSAAGDRMVTFHAGVGIVTLNDFDATFANIGTAANAIGAPAQFVCVAARDLGGLIHAAYSTGAAEFVGGNTNVVALALAFAAAVGIAWDNTSNAVLGVYNSTISILATGALNGGLVACDRWDTSTYGIVGLNPVGVTLGTVVGDAEPHGNPVATSEGNLHLPVRRMRWIGSGGGTVSAPPVCLLYTSETATSPYVLLFNCRVSARRMPVQTTRFSTFGTPKVGDVIHVVAAEGTVVQTLGAGLELSDYAIDFTRTAAPDRCLAAQVADVAMQNGPVNEYDGTSLVEYGFVSQPAYLGAVNIAGTLTGTYSWAVVYSWTDANGNVMLSPVSYITDIAVVAAGKGIQIAGLPHTRKDPTKITCMVYRLLQGTDTVFRYVGSVANVPGGIATLNDNGLTARDVFLYTTGGVLENEIPPPLSAVCAHKNRLFGAFGDTLYYSKTYVPNDVPGFNDVQVVQMPEGGPITGIRSQDNALLVFKGGRVYALAGQGMTDTGTDDDMQPQVVTVQCGCVSPRSIASTTDGTFFQAADGVYQLDRAFSLNYVGAPLEDVFAVKTISGAWYYPRLAQVRFTFTDGYQGVYDTTFKRWTTFAPPADAATITNARSALWQDSHVIAGTVSGSPVVLCEDGSNEEMSGEAIAAVMTMANVKLNGPQGFQRILNVLLVGETQEASRLDFYAIQSYGKTTETWFRDAADVAAATVGTRLQLRKELKYQTGEALQLRIEQLAESGGGVLRGITLQSVVFDGLVTDDFYQDLNSAQRV